VLAVHAFAQLPEAQALAAANRRVSNILGKLESAHIFGIVSADLLVEPQENALFEKMQSLATNCQAHLDRDEYSKALACLAALRGPVDAFFDDVMVNAEDDALRLNRLNLLKQLRDLFLGVADISLLVVTK
jgi:glycyl-tRNA synthetase beta chain